MTILPTVFQSVLCAGSFGCHRFSVAEDGSTAYRYTHSTGGFQGGSGTARRGHVEAFHNARKIVMVRVVHEETWVDAGLSTDEYEQELDVRLALQFARSRDHRLQFSFVDVETGKKSREIYLQQEPLSRALWAQLFFL